ncbi:S-adenosyl-L-methionine-dependent methyltransferases superfamily protein [Striga hermonthica]|uniref:S-adenosyl-L-methionine-dependent methyltransferases superfamily protein n=1 Tax=Striga hermonthica TaxID=68872 RepID=A0A9N7N2J9_STRHE|nr:S-adenosyl-L-methionine-dependent methyltransferases superfamily protein [Striga hermonthica]
MEKHVQILLNRLSFASIAIATLTLLLLYLQTPDTCVDPADPNPKPHTRFPKSTCDFTHRPYTSVDKRNRRLRSTNAWKTAVASYASLLKVLQARNHLSNDSRALVVSAGPGHAVQALQDMGVEDVTGVELVESPPLVSRADPHNLPFFDGIFDLGLGLYLDRALFPGRFVGQMERTVRAGGVCVVTVEECGPNEVKKIVRLFKKSRFVDAENVSLAGERRTRIVMKVEDNS